MLLIEGISLLDSLRPVVARRVAANHVLAWLFYQHSSDWLLWLP